MTAETVLIEEVLTISWGQGAPEKVSVIFREKPKKKTAFLRCHRSPHDNVEPGWSFTAAVLPR